MPRNSEVSRREFLKSGAGAAALGGIAFITRPERVFGANDRVHVGVVGLHGQGGAHVQQFSRMPDVELAAFCDVDENVLNKAVSEFEKRGGTKPATFVDLRKLLEDKSIDAISIATPNHWHSLQAIWACQAGKDVYVEKPMSHNWWEGRQLVKAAQKYNRIVQHGTNSRSGLAVIDGMKKMKEGLIGEVYLSRGLCYKWRNTIGKAAHEPVPAGVNYDLWTGPAPMKPFTKNRFHYNWHWIWDTGNGDFGNQGIHELDVARWGLGVKLPSKISAIGGHVMFDDDQETPNVLNIAYEFRTPDGKVRILEFEVRHWMSNHEAEIGTPAFGSSGVPAALGNAAEAQVRRRRADPNTIGNIFYGSKGYMAMDGYDSYKTWLGQDQEPGPSQKAGGNNWTNWIQCVKSRKKEDLNAPIEEGHYSCTLLHLGNWSYRLGRTLNFDPEKEMVIGDDEANLKLKGTFREPYVVPESV
ncbi:MAG TPA: Gfo/Idh/MocA family oxidoreductase [Acidobacteriota bacterium]|nr:Gfo/Idh/MocA family oxidoreductase [Acidobacteriota bacterium]